MTLRDWQSSQERKTVRDLREKERRQYALRPRHLILVFGLGFLCSLVLMG